jgi:hypothetical protein
MDLVPPAYVVDRFFAAERDKRAELEDVVEAAAHAIAEYTEEHTVEDGLLWEAVDDEGKMTAKLAIDRLREARAEGADEDEIDALAHVIALFKVETDAKKAVKNAQAELDLKTLAQYGKLTEADVKSLVIEDKWGATLARGVDTEVSALIQLLVARLDVLTDRYGETVGALEAEVASLSTKVADHLAAMEAQGVIAPWVRTSVGHLIDGLAAGVSVRSTDSGTSRPAVLKTSAIDRGRFVPSEAKTVLASDVGRARCEVVAGSLIISRMNTPLLVGDVGFVDGEHPGLYLPDRLWLARSKRGSDTNMRWLTYYFASEQGARQLRGLATGTSGSMKNIPKDRVLALEIDVPATSEQDAIAAALADADHLIDSTERLIAKRRDIKQGMIQELLTGRTRLALDEGAA